MTDTTLAMIEAELERARQARVSEFGPEALAWLAFPPVWTDRLARACGFPQRQLSLDDLLHRAEAVGWCVRRETRIRARTPALRLHLLVELGELGSTVEALRGIRDLRDEALRARLLARLARVVAPDVAPDVIPEIHAAARSMNDPVNAADVMLAIATRDREHAESVRLYLRGLLDQITDPEARATHLLRFRELTVVETRSWRREFLDYLVQITDPALVARLLRDAAPWLDEEDVPSLVTRPPEALGDAAVALARGGHHEQALEWADSITDESLRLQTLAELVVAAHLDPRRAWTAGDLATRCIRESRRVDLVTRIKVLTCIAQVGWIPLADEFRDVAERASATNAQVAALQQLTTALHSMGATETTETPLLIRRSTTLAAQLPDPASRVVHLAEALRLFHAYGVEDKVKPGDLIAAARAIHDDEDRARALARVAVLLPSGKRDLAAEALNLAGQLDAGMTLTTFWVPDRARGEILGELRREQDQDWVQRVAGTIGQSVAEARQRGDLVPEAMARWAELAAPVRRGGARGAASALEDRVRLPLEVGDTGQALGWLDTAKSLTPLLLGEFETAVVANTRRVELIHRRQQDLKRLDGFLPRSGQIEAFERLVAQDGEGGPWALHYLGVGGVGKTTLIRHLTARLAPDRGVVTSRIDFDYLSPDYPRRRPAQLLLELAIELEPHAQDRREMALFRQAYEQLQEINAAALSGATPVTVADDRFQRAIRTFAGFLQALDAPVVLILDTCEELEKFQPVDGSIEQLEATFDLIEAVHERVPRLRVVLAGRRPLARSGDGWRLADQDDEARSLLPEEKPYLLLHEIRGFDRSEAEEFLGPGHKGLDLSPEMLDAVLDRSPDPGVAAPLEWTDAQASDGQPDGPFYNPFDLDHYANWVRAEPSLAASDVASTERDIYVESRIIGRLRRPEAEHADDVQHAGLERLLPAVAALGRFERDMLRPAFDGDDARFADAWRELAAAEWTDLQFDAALDTTFLKVDDGLRPRLAAYYQRSEHLGLHQEAARRLGPGLAKLVDERPLERLGVDHVTAALRLLPPAECARLVDRLSWKVIEDGAWGWAERVVERVLADQPALGRPEHPAAAGLWALQASAVGHLDPGRDLSEIWHSVEQATDAHPDWGSRVLLQHRADLGQRTDFFEPILDTLAHESDERYRPVLVGGLLAAVQDHLDKVEAGSRTLNLRDMSPSGLEVAVLGLPSAVRAFARLLSARVFLLDSRFDEAEQAFADAVALVTDPGAPPAPWLYADWLPPDDLVRRVWLEALRAPIKEVGRPSLGPPPMPEGRLGGIDADRFASAALSRRLAWGVVPAEELFVYEQFEDLLEIRQPVGQAHRAVPPFFISVARGWLVLGEAERARSLLVRGEEAAIRSRDSELVKLINLERMEVVRRFRNRRWDQSLRERMHASDDEREQYAAASVALLVGPPFVEWPDLATTPMTEAAQQEWVSDHPLDWEESLRRRLRHLLLLKRVSSEEVRREVDHVTPVIGTRRVAELLLEQGELLALHPPAVGVTAIGGLDLASTLFDESSDSFGAFAATVTAILARARAGEPPGAGTTRRLRQVHESLRRVHGDSVAPLQEETSVLSSIRESAWDAWMYRLPVALAWAMRSETLPGLLEVVAAAGYHCRELVLPEHPERPAQPSSTARPASPEHKGDPHSEDELEAPKPNGAWRQRRRRRVLMTLGAVAVIALLTVVTSIVLLIPTQRLTSAFGDGAVVAWDNVPRPIAWILSVVVAGLLGVLALKFRAVQAWFYRRRLKAPVNLPAWLQGSPSGPDKTLMRKLGIRNALSADFTGPPGFSAYAEQQDVLPEPVRRALRTRGARGGVALHLPSGGHGPAWEAPVLLTLGDIGAPCWRPTDPFASLHPPLRRLRRRYIRRVLCFVLAPLEWEDVLRKLHGRIRGDVVRPVNVEGEEHDLPPGAFQGLAHDALVLLGTPVETSAGLRLRVSSATVKGPEPEDYIEPDSLGLQGGAFSLVVVIGEPSGSLTRIDAEREQAADLRRVAASLVDAGAEAVLSLPAMPPDLTGDVLKLLGRHLRRIRAFGPWELVRASTRIRRKIAAAGATDEERAGAEELALDVAVWVRP